MRKLLSLPPNLVKCFHDVEKVSRNEWYVTNDPIGKKLGSGGGTTWLLESCYRESGSSASFSQWLGTEKRILLHAGGQSRRLPSYAPSGKILTPVPVFRWKRGQKISQTLLDLQLHLYERIMDSAPDSLHTLIASGDVLIRTSRPLGRIPDADVVCYGMWVDASLAKNHGVFVSRRSDAQHLDFMLQKPSIQQLGELMGQYLFLMDIGIWILSDRAIEMMMSRSRGKDGELSFYDMYSEFGLALGNHPVIKDEELNSLSVAIIPLDGGEFYHYGTSREMISSTLAVQNVVRDQREIMSRRIKPHPAMFTQNCKVDIPLEESNSQLWIENSHVSEGWKLQNRHIITGVPVNDWKLSLAAGVCVDVVPFGDNSYVARPYGFEDTFKGDIRSGSVKYLGMPFAKWAEERGIDVDAISHPEDLQSAAIFPVCDDVDSLGQAISFMCDDASNQKGRRIWQESRKVSADEISSYANLKRLFDQREMFMCQNLPMIAKHYDRSVFYQTNLDDMARIYADNGISLPSELPLGTDRITRIQDAMFRSRALSLSGDGEGSAKMEESAFRLMREGLAESSLSSRIPHLSVFQDQIVWGRSPIRIDVAGGWTDTPPFSLMEGGNVVNFAIELNGQPPLQVFVKPSSTYDITLRSIDLGAMEKVTTYDELAMFNRVGSPFSIPKAALVLCGFHPMFCREKFATLDEQLRSFGSGIEMTTLSAIPAGSGLGTSSILASTVLGALSDFCGLGWDRFEICNATLVLEQLLTTGGGWQDQYGGVLPGIKFLQTAPSWIQTPLVRWLPDSIFTSEDTRKCHLLYYTGITRTAKQILAEIVRGMFLNSTSHLELLGEMKEHAVALSDAIQRNDFDAYGRLVARTWQQNQKLDSGTNPDQVASIISQIEDLTLGHKLPGAGGGGYLYMVAKDEEAAARIRRILTSNPPNPRARFVDMSLSSKGLETSHS